MVTSTTKEYLTIKEAKERIAALTGGVKVASATLHSAIDNKKIRADRTKSERKTFGKDTVLLCNAEDIEKLAQEFLEAKGNLLTLEEAWETFDVTPFEEFKYLVRKHNIPTVDAIMWGQPLFNRERVQQTARSITSEQLVQLLEGFEDDTLLTTREAVAYLRFIWKDERVKADTLLHLLNRGKLFPDEEPADGQRTGYKFRKSTLEAIPRFRQYRHKKERIQREPVAIASSKVMAELEKKYGELIATPEAIKIIQQKMGRGVNESTAIKYLMNDIGPVGVAGHLNYFPRKEVEAWVTYPKAGLHLRKAS